MVARDGKGNRGKTDDGKTGQARAPKYFDRTTLLQDAAN
jgi:hypothetical protein